MAIVTANSRSATQGPANNPTPYSDPSSRINTPPYIGHSEKDEAKINKLQKQYYQQRRIQKFCFKEKSWKKKGRKCLKE